MPGAPKRENRLAHLQCNNCGQQFVKPVPHVAIETCDLESIDWAPTRDSINGVRCPWCSSELIGFQET
jgi:DNA-directed RNA polymerase subunit RPC12/RpoP